MRFGCTAAAAILLLVLTGRPATARQAPDPREVYDLIRTNLAGITDAQLQTAAVEGLVKQLQPRVWLTPDTAGTNAPAVPLLCRTATYEGPTAYLRIGAVREGLARALETAFEQAVRSNGVKGLVLDLRFATGQDYAAAGRVADLFVATEQPLLDWGDGKAQSTTKTNALRLPVAVLVNRETQAAAEALAALLREFGAAVIIGTNTAGRAWVAEGFKLSNGQELRIARTGVRLGDGTILSAEGVQPDVTVAVSSAEEKAAWEDPFKDVGVGTNSATVARANATNSAAGTNRTSQPRLNEATLVRERSRGAGAPTNARPAVLVEPAPALRDAALARAVDLIKALALVNESRTK
jgi:hypothetical protein